MFKIFLKAITAFLILIGINTQSSAEKQKPTGPVVVLETTQGSIEIQLMPQIAPKTCENFLGLVEKGFYEDIIFHRIIKNFMLQGGDPTGTGRGGNSLWGKPFEDEVSREIQFDRPGLLAMANSGPNTNGSQFFITTIATPWLNMNHTIFGEVITGYENVEKLDNVQTGPGDKPLIPQKILKAYIK
jgi:peptidylprolyl isomerase